MARPSRDSRIGDVDRYRGPILTHPAADDIDPGEVQRFLASLPIERFPTWAYASRGRFPYTQPRGGVPIFEKQRELSHVLAGAGADFIPLTIDSYTRHNQYQTAEELLRRSEQEAKNYLNGYPLVSHGHLLTRELYTEIDRPISLRHGTPDARLLVELAIASGIAEIEGGGLCYCIPYSDSFPLDRALLYWQYVDRVCALYSTPERPIHRESFGPLTATMVPPSMVVAIEILEALLAAEQGVMSFAVSFGQTGSIAQDLATARVLRRLLAECLEEFGFADMQTRLVFHQWMGQFPHDRAKAGALIAGSALVANLVHADKIVVKTVDEALGVPDPESNAEAVQAVQYVLRTFALDDEIDSDSIRMETELIEAESRAILQAVFDMPGDVFWESVFRAFQKGYLDVPFSPHVDSPNRLLSIRDRSGSIRISDPGAVPIGESERSREQELLRRNEADFKFTYHHLLDDILVMV